MIQRFLIAAIVGILVLTSQIASAADIDWNSAPRIGSKAEFARYVEKERRKGNTTFCVILTNGLKIDSNEFSNSFLTPATTANEIYSDENNTIMVYKMRIDYPGTRVANAYLSGNKSKLTDEELQLYNVAVKIVNEANKFSSQIVKELYIYNEICRRTNFYTEEPNITKEGNLKAFCTAMGVFFDDDGDGYGKSNCQGYADAFYMLGRMMNLNVSKISGELNGGAHTWNTIEFGDGKVYCVDVTFGDTTLTGKEWENVNTYTIFNAPIEIMQAKYSCQWDIVPNLQRTFDNRYSYRTLDGLAQVSSAEDGLKLIARKFATENKKFFRVMAPFDQRFSFGQPVADYIANELATTYRCSGSVGVYVEQCGNYLFFTARIN